MPCTLNNFSIVRLIVRVRHVVEYSSGSGLSPHLSLLCIVPCYSPRLRIVAAMALLVAMKLCYDHAVFNEDVLLPSSPQFKLSVVRQAEIALIHSGLKWELYIGREQVRLAPASPVDPATELCHTRTPRTPRTLTRSLPPPVPLYVSH